MRDDDPGGPPKPLPLATHQPSSMATRIAKTGAPDPTPRRRSATSPASPGRTSPAVLGRPGQGGGTSVEVQLHLAGELRQALGDRDRRGEAGAAGQGVPEHVAAGQLDGALE